MGVYRKQTTRTRNGKRETIYSKRFYGTLRTFDGKRKQTPLTEDEETSEQMLRRLQGEEDRLRAVGATRQDVESQRPLKELLAEYATFLRSKGDTERHATDTLQRINALVKTTAAKTASDLDAPRISSTLARWRGCPKRKMSLSTSNHYATAIKAFSRWLWLERKTMDDPLRSLRKVNADVDRKRVRRPLTPDELRRLIHATETSRKRLRGLSPKDRAMIYLLAAFTGLRAGEIASLTPASFNLEAKTVSVQAAYSKRRRNDTLPLHASLIEPLRQWLATKTGHIWTAWSEHRHTHTACMLRSDLRRAGIAYQDEHGRYADFHSLRHTFISSLAKNGVHPLKAKELARHSTITLTMDVYSHVETDELREALNTLPAIALTLPR